MSEYLNRVALIEQDDKQCAAFHAEGSQVVIAGPGSGKTYLLSTKATQLLLEEKIRYPQKLACITYSRQLASKLVKEFQNLDVYDSNRMYVGTIHAFFIAKIIMPASSLLLPGEIPQPFRISSQKERSLAVNYALKLQGKPCLTDNYKIKKLKNNLDKFRRRYFLPEKDRFSHTIFFEANEDSRDSLIDVDWAKLAQDYRQYLAQNVPSSIDFVQVEMLALRIVQIFPGLVKTLSAAYPWWFIDEYQDLSPLFHQVVSFLVDSRRISVFAIGDPNQCIYEDLQGSNPENLWKLSQRTEQISGNRPITLMTNYRSAQNIIELSDVILGKNNQYQSSRTSLGKIYAIDVINTSMENEVGRILTKINAERIALLAPERKWLNTLMALEQSNVDIRIDKDPDFEINTELVEWVKNLAQWCTGELYFYELLPFWHTFYQPNGEYNEQQRLEVECELFIALRNLRNGDMPLQEWLTKIQETILTQTRLNIFRQFRPDDVEEFENLTKAVSEKNRLRNKSVRFLGQKDAKILLTTFHSSKGLEFDEAIVLDLDEIRESESIPELKNRLAYVAVSRAKSRLYVLAFCRRGNFAKKLNESSIENLSRWICNRGMHTEQ